MYSDRIRNTGIALLTRLQDVDTFTLSLPEDGNSEESPCSIGLRNT